MIVIFVFIFCCCYLLLLLLLLLLFLFLMMILLLFGVVVFVLAQVAYYKNATAMLGSSNFTYQMITDDCNTGNGNTTCVPRFTSEFYFVSEKNRNEFAANPWAFAPVRKLQSNILLNSFGASHHHCHEHIVISILHEPHEVLLFASSKSA